SSPRNSTTSTTPQQRSPRSASTTSTPTPPPPPTRPPTHDHHPDRAHRPRNKQPRPQAGPRRLRDVACRAPHRPPDVARPRPRHAHRPHRRPDPRHLRRQTRRIRLVRRQGLHRPRLAVPPSRHRRMRPRDLQPGVPRLPHLGHRQHAPRPDRHQHRPVPRLARRTPPHAVPPRRQRLQVVPPDQPQGAGTVLQTGPARHPAPRPPPRRRQLHRPEGRHPLHQRQGHHPLQPHRPLVPRSRVRPHRPRTAAHAALLRLATRLPGRHRLLAGTPGNPQPRPRLRRGLGHRPRRRTPRRARTPPGRRLAHPHRTELTVCGLFAFTGTHPDPTLLTAAAQGAAARGPHGHGWTTHPDQHVHRALGPMDPARAATLTAPRILGHARLATRGDYRDPNALQPCHVDGHYLAHNGTIRNWTSLDPDAPSDSVALTRLYAHHRASGAGPA